MFLIQTCQSDCNIKMFFYRFFRVLLLFILLIIFPFSNQMVSQKDNASASKRDPHSQFISKLLSSLFPQCKLFLMYGDFKVFNSEQMDYSWIDKFSSIISSDFIMSSSAGVINTDLLKNGSNAVNESTIVKNPFLVTRRPFRTISATQYCGAVIMVLPKCLPDSKGAEHLLHSQLNLPLPNPTTVRNQDKFVIVSNATCMKSLKSSTVVQKLKYKLFLPIHKFIERNFNVYQFCTHCLVTEIAYNSEFNRATDYFTDFQTDYFRHTLKVSATDKLSGLLEIETDLKSGINFPKRGIYALALLHLAKGLNFTWQLHRSSGGGSTGHPLPNGTWVGTVGDIYNGKVDFGVVCGMTLIRHPIIELCATITYEYISFAVGPRARVYTWKAIFWPFKPLFWFLMMLSTLLTIIMSYFLLRFTPYVETSSWGILTLSQYYPRVFIEQADDLPSSLPQSVKIVIGSWLVFALIGSTVYRAKMVGFMTFPVLESEPETFDELAKSKYDIQFHYFGNVAYNTFKTSTSPTYMTIFNKMSREPNPLKCLKSTMRTRKPTSCILFGCVYEELKNRNLSDRFGQSPIRISPNYGFMYTPGVLHEKNADFSANFKWILQNSMERGLNQQWEKSDLRSLLEARNGWLKTLDSHARQNYTFHYESVDSDVLHLENLKGAFSVLVVGLLFALIVFAGEKIKRLVLKVMKKDNLAGRSNIIGSNESANPSFQFVTRHY